MQKEYMNNLTTIYLRVCGVKIILINGLVAQKEVVHLVYTRLI